MRTPMRDSLSINDATPRYEDTPMDERRRANTARRALKAGFASLPKPENNFELAEDEDEEVEDEEAPMTEEDAAERDAKLKAAREEEERLELERRSSVVKKGLPRPANVDAQVILRNLEAAVQAEDAAIANAIRLINIEMAQLMKHDSLAHPLPGSAAPGGSFSEYDMPEDDLVSEAKKLVHAELAGAMGLPGASDEHLRRLIGASAEEDEDAFATSWAKEREGLVYHPHYRSWVDTADLSPAELAQCYEAMIASSTERMVAEATKAAKSEKKLSKQLGGYQAINAKTKASIVETVEEIHQARRELETFMMLRNMEEAAAPGRLEKKREEVAILERRERDLQARYAELNDERRERTAAIEQVCLLITQTIDYMSLTVCSSRKTRSCSRHKRRSMLRSRPTAMCQ